MVVLKIVSKRKRNVEERNRRRSPIERRAECIPPLLCLFECLQIRTSSLVTTHAGLQEARARSARGSPPDLFVENRERIASSKSSIHFCWELDGRTRVQGVCPRLSKQSDFRSTTGELLLKNFSMTALRFLKQVWLRKL